MDETPVAPAEPKSKTSWLALGGLLVAALLIAAGGLYLQDTLPEYAVSEVTPESLETQSDSTEPEAIAADLEAETPDEFDQELDTAFAELDASLGE